MSARAVRDDYSHGVTLRRGGGTRLAHCGGPWLDVVVAGSMWWLLAQELRGDLGTLGGRQHPL